MSGAHLIQQKDILVRAPVFVDFQTQIFLLNVLIIFYLFFTQDALIRLLVLPSLEIYSNDQREAILVTGSVEHSNPWPAGYKSSTLSTRENVQTTSLQRHVLTTISPIRLSWQKKVQHLRLQWNLSKLDTIPRHHTTLKRRCMDVVTTLFWRRVLAGLVQKQTSISLRCLLNRESSIFNVKQQSLGATAQTPLSHSSNKDDKDEFDKHLSGLFPLPYYGSRVLIFFSWSLYYI